MAPAQGIAEPNNQDSSTLGKVCRGMYKMPHRKQEEYESSSPANTKVSTEGVLWVWSRSFLQPRRGPRWSRLFPCSPWSTTAEQIPQVHTKLQHGNGELTQSRQFWQEQSAPEGLYPYTGTQVEYEEEVEAERSFYGLTITPIAYSLVEWEQLGANPGASQGQLTAVLKKP